MCEVKKCNRCKKEYPISHFTNIYGKELKTCSKCRASISLYYRAYRQSHLEILLEKERTRNSSRVYSEEEKQRRREYAKRKYYENRDKIIEWYKSDEYRARERARYKTDKVQQRVKAYRQREDVKEARRLYSQREDVKERVKLNYQEKKQEIKEKYQTLPDSVIKGQLKAKGFLPEEITEDLIQLQRAEVMLKRKVWKTQKEQGIHYTQKQIKSKTE